MGASRLHVFCLPKEDSTDYFKRPIGLPSDHIQMVDGPHHINGVPVMVSALEPVVHDRQMSARAATGRRESEAAFFAIGVWTK
jgi:hypothetical protein